MRRTVWGLLVLFLVGAACDNKNPAAPVGAGILVIGSDMGDLYQNLSLTRGGNAVTGATVTVNGTSIPETSPGFYTGQLPAPVSPGQTITLDIKAGTDTLKGVATVAPIPVITSPTTGTGVHPGTPVGFAWTSTSNPDEFSLQLAYDVSNDVTRKSTTVAGSARNGTVDTTGIPLSATNAYVEIYAYTNGTFSGSFAEGSKMHVRQTSHAVTVVILP